MDDDAIRRVVEGTDDLYEREPTRVWRLVAVVLVAVAVLVAGSVILVNRMDDGGTASPDDGAPGASTATSSTQPEPIRLVAFEADPPVLFYPTFLPEGWEVCSAQLGNPIHTPDVLCDPNDPTNRITIQVLEQGGPGGTTIESGESITMIREDPPVVGVKVGSIEVGQSGLRVEGEGVTFDQLVAVASSIPLARPIPRATGTIISVDEQGLAALGFSEPTSDVRGNPGGGWEAYGAGVRLYVSPVSPDDPGDASLIAGLVRPVVVSPKYGIVVGGLAVGQRGTDTAVATWVQGGQYWFIQHEGGTGALTALVLEMEEGIGQLPSRPVCERWTQSVVTTFFIALGAEDIGDAMTSIAVDDFDYFVEEPHRSMDDATDRSTLEDFLNQRIAAADRIVALTDLTADSDGTFEVEIRTQDGGTATGYGTINCDSGLITAVTIVHP